NGNIFVTEFFGNRVQVFDSNWNYINQFGSSGTGDGEFDKPFKIILAPNGDILVGDGLNGRVQVFHADPCAGTEFIFDIENAQLTTDNGVDGMNVFRVDVCGGNPNYSLELSSTPSNIFAMVDQFYKSPNCRSIRVTYGDHAEWVVRVVDTNDCSGEISYLDVAADGQMSIVGFASTNESKAGSSDGTASVVVVGGNDPYGVYTYEWTGATTSITVTDGSDGNTQTGLPSGIYTVVVTDAANNSQTITGVVRQNRWRGRGRRGGVGKTALTEGGEMFLTVAPNPFADYSTIQFQTPIAENVSIDVFSMNGQQVANLFEGQSNAESIQSVTFDRGYLQSGTYLVRLVTESGVVQHQKVVVM
ncbi:MAG: T9SS type A sorting domain-containing protein, partial [Chitinophagales bacterium]